MYAAILVCLAAGADDPSSAKPAAVAPWTHQSADPDAKNDAKKLTIDSAAALVKAVPAWAKSSEKEATEAVAKSLRVKTIDWDKQMLVVVTAGSKPTGGWRVEVTSAAVKGDTMTVTYAVSPPDGFATQAFTHPGVVALVPRHKGKVEFVQAKK